MKTQTVGKFRYRWEPDPSGFYSGVLVVIWRGMEILKLIAEDSPGKTRNSARVRRAKKDNRERFEELFFSEDPRFW